MSNICFMCFLFFCNNLYSSDLKLCSVDSIEKFVMVPFSVRFNHRLSLEDVEKKGVAVAMSESEKKLILSYLNKTKLYKKSKYPVDYRIQIIAKKGNKLVEIGMDAKLLISYVNGVYCKTVTSANPTIVKQMIDIIDAKKTLITNDYNKKTYGVDD